MKSERFRAPLRIETSFSLRYSSSSRRKTTIRFRGSALISIVSGTHMPIGQGVPRTGNWQKFHAAMEPASGKGVRQGHGFAGGSARCNWQDAGRRHSGIAIA